MATRCGTCSTALHLAAADGLICKQLYPAKTARDRESLVEEFVKKHGELAREGIHWDREGWPERQERPGKARGPTGRQCRPS